MRLCPLPCNVRSDESEAIHNLDDEVRNHEILDLGRSEDFYLANHGSKCDVLMVSRALVPSQCRRMT